MRVEIQDTWFSVDECDNNPTKLFVFGDNLERIGTGGQAIIRNCSNSIGIATKKKPSMQDDSFFHDKPSEAIKILNDIQRLIVVSSDYEVVVFPADGLGTGLSKMQIFSPKLCNWLHNTLSVIFNIDYTPKNEK
jgi:hypothetical protein